MRRIGWVALVLVVAACGVGPAHSAASSPPTIASVGTTSTSTSTSTTTSTTAPPSTTTTTTPWVLGATPLPTDSDGEPEVVPTPPQLVDRELPTIDVLPPPPDDRFYATIEPIDDATRVRMGDSWHEGCPVGLSSLRHVTVSFVGFDGAHHTGELIVAASVDGQVVDAFRALFALEFPIEQMSIVTTADLTAPATGDGNVTAGFVCRSVRGSSQWSSHARGLAIDINPFQNPYSKGDKVLPELASAYLDRSNVRPGMILPGDAVTRAFASVGWTWGGSWASPVDRMHFSADGH